MAESLSTESLDDARSEIEYQSLEPRAVVAVILGVLSALALLGPAWWFVPIVALLVGWMALGRIRRDGRPGRTAALVGVALAATLGTAGVARVVATQWLLTRQARPVADLFMQYLHEQSPQKALLLTMVAEYRHPIDESLWSFFRSNAEIREQLDKMLANPAVRLVLALGESAEVRYYGLQGISLGPDHVFVDLLYTVTFDDPADHRKKTYFFGVRMERKDDRDPALSPWRVAGYGGGGNPGS